MSTGPKLNLEQPLHHAYCLVGQADSVIDDVKDFLAREVKFRTTSNPDFLLERIEKFGVGNSADLIRWQILKSIGPLKVAVISSESITREAQNALLKAFEEPTLGTHFFLILPSSEKLLATFRSRIFVVNCGRVKSGVRLEQEVGFFLEAPLERRFSIIKAIADKKDSALARNFLDELEIQISRSNKLKQGDPRALQSILRAKNYLADRSPSVKMLLDWVAIETNN